VHMLNALTGSIDRPGGVMTQRYLPPQAYPDLPEDLIAEKGRTIPRFDGAGWRHPLARHSYQSVADRVLAGDPLEVLFLYDANPVFDVPGGSRFIDAFERISLVVSFSSFLDESAQYADLVLPEPTFLERYEHDHIEGMGYPGVALRQPAISPRLNTMNTGDFLLRVAAEIGGPVASAFPWRTYEELLRYRLRDAGTDFETIKELGVWIEPGYRFAPRGSGKWNQEVVGSQRRLSPRDGRFDFFSRELSGVIETIPQKQREALGISIDPRSAGLPHYLPTETTENQKEFPFLLNVITLMSLGPSSAAANMPTLQEISGMTVNETWDSWLEMNPEAGHRLGLHDKDRVWVESAHGKVKTRVRFVKALRPDVVNLPYNQGHTAVGRWARNRGVNGLDLLSPRTEPLSGLGSFTSTRVKVYRA
jgi:menaquinone reductase, molybdopterin-binding-like subunit